MMLDVAGGIIIAAIICGLFVGAYRLTDENKNPHAVHANRWGIAGMLLAVALAAWIIVSRWPVS